MDRSASFANRKFPEASWSPQIPFLVRGENTHHMIEACFKSVARALRQAVRREGVELPSTKGAL